MKPGGCVRIKPGINRLAFGLIWILDPGSVFPLVLLLNVCNFYAELGLGQGTGDYISVLIRILHHFSNFLKL